MSAVKERILGAVTVMSDADAEKVWELIRMTFTLANVEETEPFPDEIAALEAYHNGDSEYCEFLSSEEAMKELGL